MGLIQVSVQTGLPLELFHTKWTAVALVGLVVDTPDVIDYILLASEALLTISTSIDRRPVSFDRLVLIINAFARIDAPLT